MDIIVQQFLVYGYLFIRLTIFFCFILFSLKTVDFFTSFQNHRSSMLTMMMMMGTLPSSIPPTIIVKTSTELTTLI